MKNSPSHSLDNLLELYRESTGSTTVEASSITGSASQRRYYHLHGTTPIVGVIGNNIAENEAFIHICNILAQHSINVPKIINVSNDRTMYLQDDLGDTTLYDLINRDGFTPHVITLCKKSINQLVKFQTSGAIHIDTSFCFPVPSMTGDSVMWDLNYFKYCFLKTQTPHIDEPLLEQEFKRLVSIIEGATPLLFIHRDFQSRNILIHDSDAWIIDFQGGRRGPALYDIVSFLWQARANFPDSVRRQLLNYYISTLDQYIQLPADLLDTQLDYIIIFRMLQVLGAYGFRGLIQQNQRFITHIPQALKCLSDSLKKCSHNFPYLSKIIESLADTHITDSDHYDSARSTLTVTVYSFSYKQGIPADNSGNGGGFVFDCRAIHNPGRYDRYKHLTGNDLPVMEFLEQDGEITRFLDHCKALVDASVQRYISRGFTSLYVSFGCTGGQHRSVYSATHMAKHIAERYGIHVRLIHREQNITKEFNS